LKNQIETMVEKWAQDDALRILAFAMKPDASIDLSKATDPAKFVDFERNLTFVGCVGMLDPPRPEVAQAIEKCNNAGIRVMMITGDNQHTAQAIGGMIGIDGKSMTGKEFASLDKQGQRHAVKNVNVFSRTDPGQKQDIVDLLKEDGWVVAMTGDGVNEYVYF
jgi:Ca2+ transporting ATPase